jgi:hypothetical protein
MGYDYAQATAEQLEQWAIERLLREYEELQAGHDDCVEQSVLKSLH